MAISMKKYVDIKSGINNIRTATEKELIARIFTDSVLANVAPTEFSNLKEVENFFGNTSDEYTIAAKYFSFINKYSRSPRKISFSRDFRSGVNAILGGINNANLEALKLISDGKIKVTMGNITQDITGIDLTSATSLDDVASILQTAIRSADSDNKFTLATVFADGNKLLLQAGTKDKYTISVSKLDDNSLIDELGWDLGWNNEGRPVSTITQVFEDSYQANNNFATFAFISSTSTEEISTLGIYVAENYPSEFMFVVPVTSSDYQTLQAALSNINGVSLELCGTAEDTGKFNFVLPMAITATTDYNKENGTVDYMYTQDANMNVIVDNDTEAEQYDDVKVNYYGRTQQAGQKLAFYQNGVLQGNYQDQNIYVNEIWLKDALVTKFLNYMLLTANWYANKAGQSIGQGLIVDIIERAKLNGTITTEKEISENDKVYIYNVTADENAWRQIYELGYYLITSISKVTINNQETYQFNYTLLYSKGDSIKKVEGQNILI